MSDSGTPLLAGAYFDFLFGSDHGFACIRTFPGGRFGHKDGPVQRHWFQWPQRRNEMIAFVLANSTLDLYVIPALFENNASNRASNIKHQTMVYADADGAGPELFLVTPTITMETSPGRHHLFWKTTTDNSAELCLIGKAISHAHASQGCDKGGWDAGQLLRIPGTTNNKPRGTGPYFVRATTSGELFDVEDLRDKYPADLVQMPITAYGPMPTPASWPTREQAEEILVINTDLRDLYYLEPNYRDEEGKRYNDGIPFDASGRMWRLLSELSRRSIDRYSAMALAWNAGCCKYRLDGRPAEELWRELCKAYGQPENQPAITEAGIESHLMMRDAEQAARDGREVVRMHLFLSPEERKHLADDTMVDRYVQWAGTITDAAKQYHKAGILTVLSAVFGEFGLPPTKFYMGRLNLWFLVLGGTTRSRKSTARHMWLKLLRDLQTGEYDYDIGSDVTPEALAEELSEKPGWSSVFHRDEVHGLLGQESSKGYLAGLREDFTELYDGHVRIRKRVGTAGTRGNKKKKPATTTNFIMNWSGVTDHVTESLEPSDFASGFLARFLYVYADAPKRTRKGERMEQFQPTATKRDDLEYLEIREELKAIRSFWEARTKRGEPVRIPFELEAWERLNDFAWDLGTAAAESDMAKMLEPVADRMAKSVLKVACLLAMSEASATVKMRHMLKAIELGEEWFHHMLVIANRIRESGWQRQQDDVIATLDAVNGRMTWTSLYKKFRGKLRPKQFEEIIQALSEAGEVRTSVESRNKVVYRIGNSNEQQAKPGAIPAAGRTFSSSDSAEAEKGQEHGIGSFLGADDIPA